MKQAILGAWTVILLATSPALGQADGSPRFRIDKIAPDVYAFITPEPLLDWVDGNSYAIVTDDGVFVVDAHHVWTITEANIRAIQELTDKPVRYVLNTHWHGDHNTGNPVYKRHYPDVQIISHWKTREILARKCPEWMGRIHGGEYDKYIDYFQKFQDEGKNAKGEPLSPEERSRNERILLELRRFGPDVLHDECLLPDVTFEKSLTLYLGGREIQIRHEHRANTPGDAYIWLPQDSILITGDMLVHPIPYCFGSFYEEWAMALDTMLSLNPRVILPGHGEPMRDTLYLRMIRDLFVSLTEQAKPAVAAGITSVDSLMAVIDISRFRDALASDDFDRNRAFESFTLRPMLGRIAKLLRGELGDDRVAN